MKKIFIVLVLLCLTFNVNAFSVFADEESKVKVIYSTINIFADCNVNVDFNSDGESLDIICTATYGETLTLLNLEQINGQDGYKYFYVNKVSGKNNLSGYVLCSNVILGNVSSPIKQLDVNAKTNNEAKVYTFNGSEYIETDGIIPKGQGIKILQGYNRGSEYTYIQYKLENQEIVCAYIKTADILVSGISKTTIGAIVIIITTISLVLLVFGLKGRRKRKAKR